jgi:SAM-dependent methyltransferase
MLEQIEDLIRHCFGGTATPEHSAPRAGAPWTPGTPAAVLEEAERRCRQALTLPSPAARSASQRGALALISYVAALPEDVRDGIEPLPFFRDDIERAWQEPFADTYVSLCSTVQDVWTHAFGPEVATDGEVLRELLHLPVSSVLDFGAGAGHFAIELATHNIDVDAVEVDAVKASFLRHRAGHAGVTGRVHLGLRKSTYDVVLALDVLDHLLDPAAAVRSLAGRVASDGRLVTLARFPDDGWHQCDAGAIEACADVLWQEFEPVAPHVSNVPWLDVFIKAAPGMATPKPRLHPRVQFMEEDGSGECLMAAPAFYSGVCRVDAETAMLCRRLDGTRAIEELRRETGFSTNEITELCTVLHSQRLLHWTCRDGEARRAH